LWIIIVSVLGLLVLVAAAIALFRCIRKPVIEEPSSFDSRGEWFDQQEREELREMSVDFQNPLPFPGLDTLAQMSDDEPAGDISDGRAAT
jgi:hypothetical protein